MTDRPSLVARLALWFGGYTAVAAIAGPLFAHYEVVAPMTGFFALASAILTGVIAIALGVIALLRGPAASRAAAWGGLLPAVCVLIVIAFLAGSAAEYPTINDITTDTVNPPQFVHAQKLEQNAGRDMSYPAKRFAVQQRGGYGPIKPLRLKMRPDDAFALVESTARGMDEWVITTADAQTRKLEGYDTTPIFRFKDDFVIEVRENNEGESLVHMRSKSRDGQGDMGANAKRLQAFFATVYSEQQAPSG